MHHTTFGLLALFTTALLTPTKAHSGEAILPISVTLISCGKVKADIPKACKKDERCCVFMDQAPQFSLAVLEARDKWDYEPPKKFYDLAEMKAVE